VLSSTQVRGVEIPVHLVEFFDRHPEERREGKEGWQMAVEMKKREAGKLEKIGDARLQGNTGIRIREGTIKRLEELARKDLVEWAMTVLNRSTEDLVGDKEIIKGDTKGKLLLINGLTPDALSQGIHSVEADSETTLKVLSVALERKDLVIMLTCEELQEVETVQGSGSVSTLLSVENSHGTRQASRQAEGRELMYVYVWGKETQGTKEKLLAEILKSGTQGINNMYNTTEETEEEGQDWECPLCGQKGDRIGIYGICKYNTCRGVRTGGCDMQGQK